MNHDDPTPLLIESWNCPYDLDRLLSDWQKRLGLRDWTVTVELCRGRDMNLEDANGCVTLILNHRRAWIQLRDPLDVRPECRRENDLEVTLVHELLHLWTEPFSLPEAGPVWVAEEQMLNALAQALVDLAREAAHDG